MRSHKVGDQENRILASLSRADFAALKPHLESVELKPRECLVAAGASLQHVHFIHSGVVCLMSTMQEGIAETAAIGAEGMVGFEVALGGRTAISRALVQLPGTASRIEIVKLQAVMRSRPLIRELLLRYVRFFLVQTLQSVACNGLHSVEERCAKWLLLAHDRAGATDTLTLTQEFLAEVLGVHRPSVTIVARTLQNAGLIRYSRGVIVITDRKGLEESACECYSVLRQAQAEMVSSLSSRI